MRGCVMNFLPGPWLRFGEGVSFLNVLLLEFF